MNPYAEIILRSVCVYLFMLVAIRISGKKELSQLSTADIVLLLLISNSVQNAMVGPDTSLLGGISAAASLFLVNFILKKWIFKYTRIRDILVEKPEILIHNGKLDFQQLSRLNITNEELGEAMRVHGVEFYKDVKLAMLEANGSISIITGSGNLKHSEYKRSKKGEN